MDDYQIIEAMAGISSALDRVTDVLLQIRDALPEKTKPTVSTHTVMCKCFPDPFDEREPKGPCTCGAK